MNSNHREYKASASEPLELWRHFVDGVSQQTDDWLINAINSSAQHQAHWNHYLTQMPSWTVGQLLQETKEPILQQEEPVLVKVKKSVWHRGLFSKKAAETNSLVRRRAESVKVKKSWCSCLFSRKSSEMKEQKTPLMEIKQALGRAQLSPDTLLVDIARHVPNIQGGRKTASGWSVFEYREPGYLKGLYQAHFHASSYTGKLSPDFLKELHRLAMGCLSVARYRCPGQFSVMGPSFGLSKRNMTELGLLEMLKKMRNGHAYLDKLEPGSEDGSSLYGHEVKQQERTDEELGKLAKVLFERTEKTRSSIVFTRHDLAETGISVWINKFIEEYENSIASAKDAKDDTAKIHAIVTLVQNLEQLHPFSDGNCRVFCMVLLNYLLRINNLSPVILNDPNVFDAFDITALIKEIHRGMENYRQLHEAQDPEQASLFGVRTYDLFLASTEKEAQYFVELFASFVHGDGNNALESILKKWSAEKNSSVLSLPSGQAPRLIR
jgi:prophage maintenance system killer protein